MINSIGKESSLTESNHKIECQVYDDLSTFMQIFKKLLTAIEELTLSRLKELPKDNAKEKFKELSQTMKPLLIKYPFGSVISLHQERYFQYYKRTFYRFICRLHQSLSLYQIKYHQVSSLDAQFISHTLSDIKEVIKKNQSPQKFPQLIRRIQIIIDKFLRMQIEQQVKKSLSPYQKIGIKKVNIIQKMDIKLIKIKRSQLAKQGNERFSYLSNQSEEQQINDNQRHQTLPSFDNLSYCKSTSFLFPSSYESELQNRFQMLKGLDLNYQSFKTTFIQAKSRGDDFYESCLERNSIISRIMKTYRDDFQLFQKRKGIKRYRRELRQQRINLSLQKKNSQTVQRFPNHTAQSQRINPQNKLKSNNVTFIHNENSEHLDEQQLQNKKQSYRMNNVYMTFGKPILKGYKLPQKYPFITPSIVRKKNQLQSLSFNSSIHPSNDYAIVKSIDIRQGNLKIISEMKPSRRMKTTPDQHINMENSLQKGEVKQLMRSYKEAMPIRGINKKRYLQLDCTNSKDISLNKIILTGNNKNVKLNKLDQQKLKSLFS